LDESQFETRAFGNRQAPGAPLEKWGPFERLERVGRGSFGEVYRAFDPTLQRYVALKVLLPRGLDPEAEASELLREARTHARVRHPNIVPIHGAAVVVLSTVLREHRPNGLEFVDRPFSTSSHHSENSRGCSCLPS
jgi:serine/threonine protein kinase